MQIKEARGIYQSQIKSYSKTASELRQKQKELEEKIKETPNGKVVYENEAMKEAAEEQMKILEVARRLMKGAKVPQADEMKLLKFDSGLYQVAKSIGAMVQKDKREEYDSLWEDEEDKETQDPNEVADSAEAPVGAPDTVSAEMTAGTAE